MHNCIGFSYILLLFSIIEKVKRGYEVRSEMSNLKRQLDLCMNLNIAYFSRSNKIDQKFETNDLNLCQIRPSKQLL